MHGLSSAVAKSKLAEFGCNEIRQVKPEKSWILLLNQFKSPLVLILISACVISIALNEKVEAAAIGGILIINALIGFFQEFRAETAITALKKMTTPRAKVIRDGHQSLILASEIVPEDLLLLEAGDVVAADATIVEAWRFQVNEAALTGESLPISKHAESLTENKVFMGTSVINGTAKAQVRYTGMNTELGKIAHLITTAQTEQSPLQKQLSLVGQSLLVICLILVGLIFFIGIVRDLPWLALLFFSISLAVAVVPEGMPAIITVSLALGVQRMAKRNALIRKLPSVETLGSVSVICTDKTGTLTTGVMQVRELWGDDPLEILRAAASCCDAELTRDSQNSMGDPSEIAILDAAKQKGINSVEIEEQNPRVSSEPFDSNRRMMSVLRQDGVNYVKGAPESLAAISIQDSSEIKKMLNAASEMSARGLRVLAIAVGPHREEKDLTVIGLLGMADPPREEVMLAIREARSAGITPVMITGDHPQTAKAIAKELGLILEGESPNDRVHARATPEDKLKLIRQWKDRGAVVAMTGDGVNDAAALREAHIGIAMGLSGTEVTREAADLVLADDNFSTIVAAIREGRGIYENIRKAIIYLLTGNFAEIALVLCAVSMGLPLPLLPVHLLWINLVTDALPALTLVADPLPPNIMQRRPRPAQEKILGRVEWSRIIVVGLIEGVVCLSMYWYLLNQTGNETQARSLTFTTLVFSQLLRSFGARSDRLLFWEVGALSNLWLLGVVISTGALQLSLHSFPWTGKLFGLEPLTFADMALVFPCSLIPVTLIEVKKLLSRFEN